MASMAYTFNFDFFWVIETKESFKWELIGTGRLQNKNFPLRVR